MKEKYFYQEIYKSKRIGIKRLVYYKEGSKLECCRMHILSRQQFQKQNRYLKTETLLRRCSMFGQLTSTLGAKASALETKLTLYIIGGIIVLVIISLLLDGIRKYRSTVSGKKMKRKIGPLNVIMIFLWS